MSSVWNLEIQQMPELSVREKVGSAAPSIPDALLTDPQLLSISKDTPEGLLDRNSFETEFKTDAYLQDFYQRVDEPAMQMVLTFLPCVVARIGKIRRVLDFGAGPTIHVACSFRETAEEIYLSDYLPQNREELIKWKNEESGFDWSTPLKMIARQEGIPYNKLDQMQAETRKKVRGIFHCDCFLEQCVDSPPNLHGTFDVLVTIFCIEYCCNSYDEYKQSVKNMAKQVADGGYFIMGGILEETWCSFGGKMFTCLFITHDMMMSALEEAGLFVEENDRETRYYEINGMFMVCARKGRKN